MQSGAPEGGTGAPMHYADPHHGGGSPPPGPPRPPRKNLTLKLTHQFRHAFFAASEYPRHLKIVESGQTGEEIYDDSCLFHIPVNHVPTDQELIRWLKDWGWPYRPLRLRLDYAELPEHEHSAFISQCTVEATHSPPGRPQHSAPQQGYYPNHYGGPAQGYPQAGAYPPAHPQQGYPQPGYPPRNYQAQGYPGPGHLQPGQTPTPEPEQQRHEELRALLMVLVGNTEGLGRKSMVDKILSMELTEEEMAKLTLAAKTGKAVIEKTLDWLLLAIARRWTQAWDQAASEKEEYERKKAQRASAKARPPKAPTMRKVQ